VKTNGVDIRLLLPKEHLTPPGEISSFPRSEIRFKELSDILTLSSVESNVLNI
jgi:hypothetical protein